MFLDGSIFFSESKKCIMSGGYSPSQLPTVTLGGAMARLAMNERRISAQK